MEAEGCLAAVIQALPVLTGGFEQRVGADDVGFDKGCWAIDGAIDVRLSGQVHYGVRLVLKKNPVKFGTVANIDMLEGVTLAVTDVSQGFEVSGVGQFVEVDD